MTDADLAAIEQEFRMGPRAAGAGDVLAMARAKTSIRRRPRFATRTSSGRSPWTIAAPAKTPLHAKVYLRAPGDLARALLGRDGRRYDG